MKFKFLDLTRFDYLLTMYNLINSQFPEPTQILIESTFFQIYATLEEVLYGECKQQIIKKNASIIRFEPALKEQGFNLNNEAWDKLVEIAKIRNCLIHGNGRIDQDKYGEDTKATITSLNRNAKTQLVEFIDSKTLIEGSFKIKAEFLVYFVNQIKIFAH